MLALRVMPLAQTYAIGFSTPLIATAVAAMALGERASPPVTAGALGTRIRTVGPRAHADFVCMRIDICNQAAD
jgi:hypothetical protein